MLNKKIPRIGLGNYVSGPKRRANSIVNKKARVRGDYQPTYKATKKRVAKNKNRSESSGYVDREIGAISEKTSGEERQNSGS